jgi:predicted sulfurtransferase
MGFSETYRLADGIHGYLRYTKEQEDEGSGPEERPGAGVNAEEAEAERSRGRRSFWTGENFVFYERGVDDPGDGHGDEGQGGKSTDE